MSTVCPPTDERVAAATAKHKAAASGKGQGGGGALRRTMFQLVAGGGAGAIAKTAVSPFERIKLLCQTGESRGLLHTARSVLQQEGIAGFWRGNAANVLRIIPSKGILFMSNDAIKAFFRKLQGVAVLPQYQNVAAGSMSGLVAVACTYPLDLIRGRMGGLLGESRYGGLISTLRVTVKEEGVRALYRGSMPTLIGALPYEGIKFGTYDFLRTHFGDAENGGHMSIPLKLACGAIAGIAGGTMTYPNDTVRRRMQMQGTQRDGKMLYRNALHCYAKMFRTEGLRPFFGGLVANVIRVAPSVAIQFACYDSILGLLRLKE
jgi:hypothetical protein